MNQDSHITINVSPPRGGRALDAIKRTSARSVVDGLARAYRHSILGKAGLRYATRDGYEVAPASTEEVVARFDTEGGKYSFQTVQTNGVVSVIKSRGVRDLLDQGAYSEGSSGEIGSLTEQNNAQLRGDNLIGASAEDATHRQLRGINARNRKAFAKGGSPNMTARNSDELWEGTQNGGAELVPEGSDGTQETMDGNSLIRRMNAKNRASYGRWSPTPRKVA